MSHAYKMVQWNRHKRVYDLAVVVGVVLFVGGFVAGGKLLFPAPANYADEVLILRGLGLCAFALLHVILCIGPLARLDDRFASLLYNRRHLGVTMFLVALVHAIISLGYYGGFGVVSPIEAIFGRPWGGRGFVPFEWFGVGALAILFVMAATSHDFWLANLSPRTWKRLHMSVYLAYVLLVAHVAWGSMQSERGPVTPLLLLAGAALVGGLHWRAAAKESAQAAKGTSATNANTQWLDVASFDEIPESRAKVVCLKNRERVALFKHEGAISAVSNVCAHQGGPLGEGKVVGGCITCPWHGYQYLPHNGQSPPPYTEKIPTYQVRVEAGRVLLNPEPLPPGTPTPPGTPGTPVRSPRGDAS